VANIQQIPYNLVPDDWQFDNTKGPFIQAVLDILRQLSTCVREDDSPGFWEKPQGEPIFMVFFGDSNCGGGAGGILSPAVEQNQNVFDYSTGGTGAALSWVVADPNGTQVADYDPLSASGYTGLFRGGYGNIGWACANLLQQRTGRDVYMLTYWRNAASIIDYLSGGDMNADFVASLASAQSTDAINGRAADLVIMEQGTIDYTMNPDEYADYFMDLYEDGESAGWNEDRYTQWLMCEFVPGFTDGFGPGPGLAGNNIRQAARRYHEYVRNVSAAGLDTTGDGVHFAAAELVELGEMCSIQAIAGPGVHIYNPEYYARQIEVVSTTNATFTEIARMTIADGFALDFQAYLYATRTDATDAYSVIVVGIAQRDGTVVVDEATRWASGPALDARAVADTDDLVIEVQGAASQDWDWELHLYYQYRN